jgi:hypothetical protein
MINLGLSLVTLTLFSVTGVRVANTTSAATSHPYGQADYCTVENNQTVIYGWAADPDSISLSQPSVQLSIGGSTINTQTNRANYRDDAVADWINNNRTGDPKPGTYGFKAVVSGLAKGNRYPLSGTVLNEGPGDNVILDINNSAPVDKDSKKSFFTDNVIPDSCLVDPAVLAAAPPPTAPTTASPVLLAPKIATSDITGTDITSGTMAAEMKIDTTGTATVRVLYGTNPLKLDQSSSDIPATGNTTMVTLTGLSPAGEYTYRIVRTDLTGKKTTSPLGSFETLGYAVALHFVDNRDNGLAGIQATINTQNKPKTSDDTGTAEFTGVAGGTYNIQYTYLGRHLQRTFTANSSTIAPSDAAAPHVVTLDYSVNIQADLTAGTTAPKQSKGSAAALVIIAIIACCALLIGIFLLVQFMRRKRDEEMWYETPAPPLPQYHPLNPQLPPIVPGQPGAQHMGESLKDMVLKGMRERTQGPPR